MIPLPPHPPSASEMPNWFRKVAGLINGLLAQRGMPFPSLTEPPLNPQAGQAYFDAMTGRARCWDGSAWNDLF